MTLRRRPIAWLLVGGALLLAGCGGGKDDSAGTTQTATATTPAERAAQVRAQTALRATQAKRMERATAPARACLEKLGYHVSAGSPRVDDDRAPDFQFVLNGNGRGHGAIIAFYDEVSRAEHYGAITRKNAAKLRNATVERRGPVNIVWVGLPGQADRARVRACIVTDA